ncbi:uncharacterized protein [Mobula birostris]|uniref:uncharacterized protein isoform X1 n=1 Tax=Mobula birostris TaxID=1983395 RepID=UPI003B284512
MAGRLVRIAALVITWSVAAATRMVATKQRNTMERVEENIKHPNVRKNEQKVYYSCGAVVSSEPEGIILSPGFPMRYAAGTHCVWQFFVPPGVRLDLEVFDFDVFEGPGDEGRQAPATESQEKGDSSSAEGRGSVRTQESQKLHSPMKDTGPGGRVKVLLNEINASESKGSKVDVLGSADKQTQKELIKVLPQMNNFSVSDSPLDAELATSALSVAPADVSMSSTEQQGGEQLEVDRLELPEGEESPGTNVPASEPPEVCPDDVLYISDLITFSVRFCGDNSPVNKTLTFGSPLEMVEVVVELITTTDQGRGFLLLYHFENDLGNDLQNPLKVRGHDNLIHFLVIGGIALLLAILLTAVCRIWRRRSHYKGRCSHCSRNREVGIQNSAADIGEMQLVPNGTHQDENENNNHSVSLGRQGNSLQAEMEVASTESVVTESGSDEIFVISAGPSVGTLHFSSFKTKVSKRSPSSSPTVCDWLVPDLPPSEEENPAVDRAGDDGEDSPSRQRTCYTHKPRDAQGPLPRDWYGWASTGPLTKLVEKCTPGNLPSDHRTEKQRKVMSDMQLEADWEQLCTDSSAGAASYPLTRSAQSQRQLASPTNLRRTWFGSPCFATRLGASRHDSSGPRQMAPRGVGPRPLLESAVSNDIIRGFQIDGAKSRHRAPESERINLIKPAFVISEAREDREPLVQAPDTVGQSGNFGPFEELKPNTSNAASEGQGLTHAVPGAS